jgi:EpsI family protein
VLEGRRIYISSGVWEVAEACSGLRYLISSVALGTLFAYVVYRSWIRRALFVAASIIVPIVANGVRAFSIVVLAHKVNPDLALGVDHLIYGWIFFAFVILLLFMVGFRWHEKPLEEKASPIQGKGQQPGPRAFPAQWSPPLITVAAILIMLTASIAVDRLQKGVSPTLGSASFPRTASPWKPVRSTGSDNWLKLATADLTKTGIFTDGEHDVKLAIIFYSSQAAQPHVGDSLQDQLAGAGWNELEARQRKTTLNERSLSVAEDTFTNGSRNRVSWSFYWVDDRLTSSSSRAKLLRAKATLLRQSSLTARIVLLTEADSAVGGSAVLSDFLQHSDLLQVLESSSSGSDANGPTH